ncbi:MAG: cyclomaltodextrinase C-terminal domain-containing protein, partial [Mariniphaga sp.]|nr:cyclomaltodextrinase C-terminal domain-containing protein [Mariniphaga sp.]
ILQNWRKNKEVIHHGKLMHFVPEDGIYTYFRYKEDEAVMIVLNKNNEEKTLSTERFGEILKGYSSGREIISGTTISNLSKLKVPTKAAMIIELK